MPSARNPILPGFYPDPSICRVGADYYLATSSFEFFPGVPLFHSRDLVHWRQLGHILDRDTQLDLSAAWESCGIYAPTLRFIDGFFYLTTTNISGQGNFFVRSPAPTGPWSEPIWVDQQGIDPSLHALGDGTALFTSSGRNRGPCRIVQSRIDLETGALLEPERTIWTGTGGKGPEAPHLFQRGDWFYLMIAEGGTEYGHMITIARSHSPWGPWDSCPHNPILSHRSLEHPIQATGHGDLVTTPDGHDFIVFLGVRPVGYHAVHLLGRETFLAPVRWTSDQWPVIGENGVAAESFESAHLPTPHPWPPEPARDHFDAPALGLPWNHLRNPRRERIRLDLQPSCLSLMGGESTLDTIAWPTWVGRRQRALRCTFTAELNWQPRRPGDEAGIAVYQNYRHHYNLAVVHRNGQRRICARRRIGSLAAELGSCALADGPVQLRITATPDFYELAFAPAGGPFCTLDRAESRYLSTEVGGRFTGVYFALWATGSGRLSDQWAHFDWTELVEAPTSD